MKKAFKWIGIGFVVLVVIGIIAGPDDSGTTEAAAPEKPAEVFKITSTELFNAYEANEVATDERMKGKLVEVSGTVESIDKDAFDNIVIRMRTPNEFMSTNLEVTDSEKAKAIALSKGAKVSIRCNSMARIMGSPAGSDCVFASN